MKSSCSSSKCGCYDPTVHVVGGVFTDNVGNISIMGPCSYPNTKGFYKKYATTDKYTISRAYVPDISPMFGGRAVAKQFNLNYE